MNKPEMWSCLWTSQRCGAVYRQTRGVELSTDEPEMWSCLWTNPPQPLILRLSACTPWDRLPLNKKTTVLTNQRRGAVYEQTRDVELSTDKPEMWSCLWISQRCGAVYEQTRDVELSMDKPEMWSCLRTNPRCGAVYGQTRCGAVYEQTRGVELSMKNPEMWSCL